MYRILILLFTINLISCGSAIKKVPPPKISYDLLLGEWEIDLKDFSKRSGLPYETVASMLSISMKVDGNGITMNSCTARNGEEDCKTYFVKKNELTFKGNRLLLSFKDDKSTLELISATKLRSFEEKSKKFVILDKVK